MNCKGFGRKGYDIEKEQPRIFTGGSNINHDMLSLVIYPVDTKNRAHIGYQHRNFYVFLTVHLSIILVIDQLHAQILVL